MRLQSEKEVVSQASCTLIQCNFLKDGVDRLLPPVDPLPN